MSEELVRITLRLPGGLHGKLSSVSQADGRPLNTEIVRRLESTFDDHCAVSQTTETEIDKLRRAIESQSREIRELRQAIQDELAKKGNN